jgi:hypothetical protein
MAGRRDGMSEDKDEFVIDALIDLFTRDVTELLFSGKEKEARALMKVMGLGKDEINEIIKEGVPA